MSCHDPDHEPQDRREGELNYSDTSHPRRGLQSRYALLGGRLPGCVGLLYRGEPDNALAQLVDLPAVRLEALVVQRDGPLMGRMLEALVQPDHLLSCTPLSVCAKGPHESPDPGKSQARL